jgi:phosphatidylserine/phosphatidylglycerophosphate/cardiolipin synthase-like enzyme
MEVICGLGPDNAGSLITRLLIEARHTIDAAVYEVGPSYRWAFVAAARRGVRVRLILDRHPSDGNAGTATRVARAGGECRVLGSSGSAAHWKLLAVDHRRVAVGTGNLIWRDAPRRQRGAVSQALHGTREWWAVSDGSRDVELCVSTGFETAWSVARRPPPAWRAHVDVAPEVGAPHPQVPPLGVAATARDVRLVLGGLPVAIATRALIDGAAQRVLATVPYVHPRSRPVRSLLAAMVSAARRGADARLLLGTPPLPEDAQSLGCLDLPVRTMDPRRSTSGHAKGLVADGSVLVASANWSSAGLGVNWEAALVIRRSEAAEYYAAAWQRDWDAADVVDSVRFA